MRQSNGYIIGYAIGLTVLLGGLLSLAAVGLKPAQDRQVELEQKKQILSAVQEVEGVDKLELEKTYDARVKAEVVDFSGNVKEGILVTDIEVSKEFKKEAKDRSYPVYKYMAEDGIAVDYYIFPVYGNGLWDKIWGFVALKGDLNTIKGIAMAHKGETPGLGARITDKAVKDRYVGKKINNASGKFVSVTMVKGESNPRFKNVSDRPNEVDGMSGATLTADGVNEMMESYLEAYQGYFNKNKK